ncbi:MAG: 50S ribosomal protein L9 [Gammaproteobacteria bacterium]|nr:50S ribosomal protein L9 [Gammaproteobacteria bacterium]MYL01839.1 50S ribosomal protein L9 [Gammaproteobacteria bacterium]
MRIILLETVESLGGIGDIVDVRAGYGRNYLLPQGKAAPATEEQIAAFEERRSELMAMERERMAATTARAAQVQAVLPLTIVANAGPVGKLYGSVGPAEISAGFEEAGVEVSRSEVQMPDGPIKELGEHPVTLKLHADVQQEATIRVVGQAGETEVLPGAEPLPADEDEDAEAENTLPAAADAATDTAGEVRESESTADEEVEETAGAEPQVLADDSAGDG